MLLTWPYLLMIQTKTHIGKEDLEYLLLINIHSDCFQQSVISKIQDSKSVWFRVKVCLQCTYLNITDAIAVSSNKCHSQVIFIFTLKIEKNSVMTSVNKLSNCLTEICCRLHWPAKDLESSLGFVVFLGLISNHKKSVWNTNAQA